MKKDGTEASASALAEAAMKKVGTEASAKAAMKKENYKEAASMRAETLYKQNPNAKCWHVNAKDASPYTADHSTEEKIRECIGHLSTYLLTRLAAAVEKGFDTLVVDEPFMSDCFLPDVARHMSTTYRVMASCRRVSRHRDCPHTNGGGMSCIYADVDDFGAYDIQPLQLVISKN